MTGIDAEGMPALACNLFALTAEERAVHGEHSAALLGTVTAVEMVENGYRLQFAADGQVLEAIAAFIRYERLCCPFFHFTVDVEAAGGAIWLTLAGPEGVKGFIAAEMGGYLNGKVGFETAG